MENLSNLSILKNNYNTHYDELHEKYIKNLFYKIIDKIYNNLWTNELIGVQTLDHDKRIDIWHNYQHSEKIIDIKQTILATETISTSTIDNIITADVISSYYTAKLSEILNAYIINKLINFSKDIPFDISNIGSLIHTIILHAHHISVNTGISNIWIILSPEYIAKFERWNIDYMRNYKHIFDTHNIKIYVSNYIDDNRILIGAGKHTNNDAKIIWTPYNLTKIDNVKIQNDIINFDIVLEDNFYAHDKVSDGYISLVLCPDC